MQEIQDYEGPARRGAASDLRQGAAALQAASDLKRRAAADLEQTAKAQSAIADATVSIQDFVESSNETLRAVREEIEAHRQMSEELIAKLESWQDELDDSYRAAIDAVQGRLGGAIGRISRGYDDPTSPAMDVRVEAKETPEAEEGRREAEPPVPDAAAEQERCGEGPSVGEAAEQPSPQWDDQTAREGAQPTWIGGEETAGGNGREPETRQEAQDGPALQPVEQATGVLPDVRETTSVQDLDAMVAQPLSDGAGPLDEVDDEPAPVADSYPERDLEGMRHVAASAMTAEEIRVEFPPDRAEYIMGLRRG